MEKATFQTAIPREKGISVKEMVTDAHVGIGVLMSKCDFNTVASLLLCLMCSNVPCQRVVYWQSID